MFCKFKNWSHRLFSDNGSGGSSSDNETRSVEIRKESSSRRSLRSRSMSCSTSGNTSGLGGANGRITSVMPTTNIPNSNNNSNNNINNNNNNNNNRERTVDPRELPRPAKYGVIRSTKQSSRKSLLQYCYMNPVCPENAASDQEDHYNCTAGAGCKCLNCKALPSLTECGVCLEPLQGQKVHSCPICANLTCKICASKLKICAFCRTSIPSLPNTALDRLLDRLALPCKNSRSGCTELVNGESRRDHEAICNHGTFGCPVGSHICGWHGNLTHIKNHLESTHELKPIIDNGIAVEISGFRGKAYADDGRQYTVCLSCYQNLYVVKIVLFQGKLRLSFSQLGSTSNLRGSLLKDTSRNYGVWIKVSSNMDLIEGALPFGKRNCETREIEIECDKIVSKDENDTNNNSVKINVVIKPITIV